MKIAFVGDSFCSSNSQQAWHHLVSAQLGATTACEGDGGASLWVGYEKLKAVIHDIDTAVLCYTDAFRLPNPRNYPVNFGSVQYHRNGRQDVPHGVNNFPDTQLWDAAVLFYQHLLVEDYQQLVHRLLIAHIDSMLAEANVRAVHFFSFEHIPMSFVSGPSCDIGLWPWLQRCGKHSIELDTDHNHMSMSQNHYVASKVCQTLQNCDAQTFTLDHVPYNK